MPNDDQVFAEGLRIQGIAKSFGKRVIVHDVSLKVSRGQVTALLGPNGAGKTTCFYVVLGLVQPDSGTIFLDGEDITKMPMYQRARMGLSYLAQEASIFRGMTVEQNIMSVVELREPNRSRAEQIVADLCDELSISHLRKAAAPGLSGGERRRVEIARALANEPSFLLMDEPFAGLDPLAVADISKVIAQLKKRQIGILITDHNVRQTLDVVDRASIIYDGQVLFEGVPSDMIADSEVRRVYLGKSFDSDDMELEAGPPGALEKSVSRPASNGLEAAAPTSALNLRLHRAEVTHARPSSWKEFWELTNKPKNSPLVFGGGIFCGLVFGLFFGTVLLHPNKPAAPLAAASGGAVASRTTVARGQAYADAFKLVSAPSLWRPYSLTWRIAKAPYTVLGDAPQTIETPTAQYDYGAVSMPLSSDVISGERILRVDIAGAKGRVGIALLNPAGSPLVSEEQIITSGDGERSVFFRIRPQDLPAEILVRNNGDASGQKGSLTVRSVYYAPIGDLSDEQLKAIRKIGLNKPVKP
jgi:lipopolysaccharide export system ATP-binding protein